MHLHVQHKSTHQSTNSPMCAAMHFSDCPLPTMQQMNQESCCDISYTLPVTGCADSSECKFTVALIGRMCPTRSLVSVKTILSALASTDLFLHNTLILSLVHTMILQVAQALPALDRVTRSLQLLSCIPALTSVSYDLAF